jgi:hypothetical protein
MIFTAGAFPAAGFSLDITEETYNIDAIVPLYEKKFPLGYILYRTCSSAFPAFPPSRNPIIKLLSIAKKFLYS